MKKKILICLFLAFYCFIQQPLFAQTPVASAPEADTPRVIDILHANTFEFRKPDSTTELQILSGKVRLRDGNTLFDCDSAVLNKKLNIVEAFGNVHINDADSIHTYSQYLVYHVDKKMAYLKKKVKLTDGKGVLTTEELDYDTQLKIGTYRKGGKVVNGATTLTSQEATYYGDLKDVYFKKNVKLRDTAYNVDTDSLLYNIDSQVATFITETKIVSKDSSNRSVTTTEGFYDMKNKIARFGRRPLIRDGAVTITGDDVLSDDKKGSFEAKGRAVMIDSAQGITIISNYFLGNRESGTFLATEHPLMILKQDADSIYITADTLLSGRLGNLPKGKEDSLAKKDTLKTTAVVNTKDTANQNRFFQGYHNVRIFSDSLQAVSDSLFYSGRDSVFKLFNNPIVWASNSQVTGDTIYLYTKNKKAELLHVFENGMAINKEGPNYYNQIKGTTLTGYFKEGNIEHMRAKGSAESVYFARDEDSAYVGMNNASADIIDMYFADKELKKVVFRNEVTGTTYPISQIPEEKLTLRNFKWWENRRPKTKFELFEDPVTKE